MTLFVVRHAHAGARGAWGTDDRRRPLSERGRRQAEALADLLAAHAVERILTSPYDRCVETVAPLSVATGVEVEHADALAEGAAPPDTRALVHALDGVAALCSHGDVIGSLIGRLRADGVELGPVVDWEKASTWVLTRQAGRIVRGRYLSPPA